MNHASTAHSTQHWVAALVAARQRARIRLHLLSPDARNHWHELESQLDCVQSRIEYEGARIKPSAGDRVHALTAAVAKFLREHANPASSELSSGLTQAVLSPA